MLNKVDFYLQNFLKELANIFNSYSVVICELILHENKHIKIGGQLSFPKHDIGDSCGECKVMKNTSLNTPLSISSSEICECKKDEICTFVRQTPSSLMTTLIESDDKKYLLVLERAVKRAYSKDECNMLETILPIIKQTILFEKLGEENKPLSADTQKIHELQSADLLIPGITHEINTPMQYIQNNITFIEQCFASLQELIGDYKALTIKHPDLLQKEAKDRFEHTNLDFLLAEIPESIRETHDGVKRVVKIVSEMKEFFQPDRKEIESVNINHILKTILTVSKNEWKNHAQVELSLEEHLNPVHCNLTEIKHVFLILLLNAISAIVDANRSTDGVIVIKTTQKEGFVEITISDNGNSAQNTHPESISKPLSIMDKAYANIGQDLKTARDIIVKKNKGTFHFAPETGQGNTITITLPS